MTYSSLQGSGRDTLRGWGARSGVLCSPTIWDSGGDNLPWQPGWCEEAPLVATET